MTKRDFSNLESSLEIVVYAVAGARRYNVTYRIKHHQGMELAWHMTADSSNALTEYVAGFVKQASNGKADLSYGCSYGRENGIGFDTTWVRDEYTSRKEVIHLAKLVGRVVQTALERKLRQMRAAYSEIEYRVTFEPGA